MQKKLIILAFAIAATHTHAQTSVSKYEDEVRKRSAIWNTAFARRDIPALTSLFSEDAQLATAGIKLKSRAECAQLFEALFKKRPDVTWLNKPTQVEIDPVWKVAYEIGDWTEGWTERDGRTEIQGKYCAIWLLNLDEGCGISRPQSLAHSDASARVSIANPVSLALSESS